MGLSSCDILTGNSEDDKGTPIKTSTASGVAAMEVLQNERGIFILGIAKEPEQKSSPYYTISTSHRLIKRDNYYGKTPMEALKG